jgi:predicted nucleic acid-binding protein
MNAECVTLDANVLVYAADTRDPVKHLAAIELVARTVDVRSKLALQAIGEFLVVSTRKLRFSPTIMHGRVQDLLATFETFPHTRTALAEAAALAASGRYFFWDGVLLASAEEAGCTVILSEDMADGSRLGNLVVRNPFGPNGLSDAAREALGLS